MYTLSCPCCRHTSGTRTFSAPKSTSRQRHSCWNLPAAVSKSIFDTHVAHDEHRCSTSTVCTRRIVLRRVSASPMRRQRAHGSCLSGYLEAVVRVRCATLETRRHFAHTEGSWPGVDQ